MRTAAIIIAIYGVYLEMKNTRNPITGAVLVGEDGRPYIVAGAVLYLAR